MYIFVYLFIHLFLSTHIYIYGVCGVPYIHACIIRMHRWDALAAVCVYMCPEAPAGFNIAIGPLTPSPSKGSASSLTRSAADFPWDPSLAPSPTVSDLRAVTAKEGDLVANGLAADRVASVQPDTLVFDSSVGRANCLTKSCC